MSDEQLYVVTEDRLMDIVSFVNGHRIPREKIVNIIQQNDGTFTLLYYGGADA